MKPTATQRKLTGTELVPAAALPLTTQLTKGSTFDRAFFPLIDKLQKIRHARGESPVIVFTSASAGDGVSHVVQSLAREIEQKTGGSVLTAKPSHIENVAALFASRSDSNHFRWESTARTGRGDSQDANEALTVLRQQYEYLILDCPPLDKSADALALGRASDGVFLVVSAGETSRSKIQAAIAALRQVSAPLAGLILNKRRYPIPKFLYNLL
jgi:Mrp family chromosome partitioning ATPase